MEYATDITDEIVEIRYRTGHSALCSDAAVHNHRFVALDDTLTTMTNVSFVVTQDGMYLDVRGGSLTGQLLLMSIPLFKTPI